jgi:cytochrome c556
LASSWVVDLAGQQQEIFTKQELLEKSQLEQAQEYMQKIQESTKLRDLAQSEASELATTVSGLQIQAESMRAQVAVLEQASSELTAELEKRTKEVENEKQQNSREIKRINSEMDQFRDETAKLRLTAEKLNASHVDNEVKSQQFEEQMNKVKANWQSTKSQAETQMKVSKNRNLVANLCRN